MTPDPLDDLLAGLDRRDRRLLADLVAEEAAAQGVADPADPAAAPIVARVLRELAERLAVEIEAEREAQADPDAPWDDDPDWDAPAIPYGDSELGGLAGASLDPSPALDAALGRFLERMPDRRRRGLLRRARRAWRREGVRDPDAPESRDAVRRALVDEALQEGFVPPSATIDVPDAGLAAPDDDPVAFARRVPRADPAAIAAIEQGVTALGPDAVREVLDQAAFLALRGGLDGSVHARWVTNALAVRGAGP